MQKERKKKLFKKKPLVHLYSSISFYLFSFVGRFWSYLICMRERWCLLEELLFCVCVCVEQKRQTVKVWMDHSPCKKLLMMITDWLWPRGVQIMDVGTDGAIQLMVPFKANGYLVLRLNHMHSYAYQVSVTGLISSRFDEITLSYLNYMFDLEKWEGKHSDPCIKKSKKIKIFGCTFARYEVSLKPFFLTFRPTL